MRAAVLVLSSAMLLSCRSAPAPSAAMAADCAPAGTSHVRTTLYFGLSRTSGPIAESEWQTFLKEQVTPRFPAGLTVWDASGQWRQADASIGHENSKVLLLIHDGNAASQAAIGELVASYKRNFQQESVLWETARVCAAF